MKSFFTKLSALVLVIFISQILVGRYVVPSISFLTFGMAGIGKLDTYLYQNEQFPVLYFGDSVIKAYDERDTDKASIAEMFGRYNPSIGIGDMSSPSYHLGMFEAMMKHIGLSDRKPQSIIIPINLRSFAPLWDKQPEYEFNNEIFFLTHNKYVFYFGKPINIWHAINFSPSSEEEFEKTPIVYNGKNIDTVGGYIEDIKKYESEESLIRESYQYFYMMNLTKNHRKLDSLRNIVDIAKANNVTLYFYVVPVDYQDGTRYLGKEFTSQIMANANVVCDVITQKGLPCFNFVALLPSKDFAHPGIPNEHLNEYGRQAVATELHNFIPAGK